MALSDAYATAADYRAAVRKTSTADDAQITLDLEMASRWWDRKLRRRAGFSQDDAPVERTYYVHRGRAGGGSNTLYVDDISTTTGLSIEVAGETLAATDYVLWPLDAALAPEPEPYDRIVRVSGYWPLDEPILVTARYGWPAVPAGIKAATIEWAAIWRGESIRATATVNALDEVQATSPYHLSQLKRLTNMYQQTRRPLPVMGAGASSTA